MTIANDTAQPAEPALLTADETARYLRLHVDTLRPLLAQGAIPGAGKVGGVWRVRRAKLDEALDAGTLVPGQGPPRKRGRRR